MSALPFVSQEPGDLQAMLLQMPVALYTTDTQGVITFYNKEAEELWLRKPEIGVDQWCGSWKVKYPDGSPMQLDECPMAITLKTNQAVRGQEIIVMRPDGTERNVLPYPQPLYDSEGNSIGALNVLVDVTKFKSVEQYASDALRQESVALNTIQQIGQSLNSTLDLSRLVQDLTDSCTKLVGAEFGAFFYNTRDEQGEIYQLYTISGVPAEAFAQFPQPRPTQLFGPTFRNEGTVRIDDVFEDPRYGKNEPYHGMPKGHLPVRSYLAASVVSQAGEVLGGLFFGHATPGMFTPRHERLLEGIAAQAAVAIDNARLYSELRKLNSDLERRVTDRTADLEVANREMEGFTYTVSHDLRSPLRAIVSTSSIIMEDYGHNLEDGAKEMLKRQKDAATRMGLLIDDLLTLSRLGRQELNKTHVDMTQLAKISAESLKQDYPKEFSVTVEPNMRALGDPKLLTFVFDNLIGNAVKFGKKGQPVHIEVGTVTDQPNTFFVRDNGIGFAPEYGSKIFLPFERLVHDADFPGTGIGLANVKRILDRHRGKVWAHSAPDEGTTIYFSLPVR